jgi:hypothetical protein
MQFRLLDPLGAVEAGRPVLFVGHAATIAPRGT